MFVLAAALGGFFIGEYVEKQILLEADNVAFQNSGQVENEVKTLNPYQRCIALGGVPNECKVLCAGWTKPPKPHDAVKLVQTEPELTHWIIATDRFGQKQKCWKK